ncbi:MAG: hypothetical protein HGB05_16185, partial [Chloroflexi bacterium]|nr:hypothetical protein [Chloroflexota bacterium]
MPRFHAFFSVLLGALFVVVLLPACASPSAYAGIAQSPPATIEPAESLESIEAQPTEGPDPVATEYALAAMETPTPVPAAKPISQPTPDALEQLESACITFVGKVEIRKRSQRGDVRIGQP